MAKGKKTKDEAAQDRIDKEQRQADAPAVEDEAEAQAETARDQAGHEKHIDSTREAIMKKSTSDRLHRKQKDTEQLDDDGKRLQEAMEAEVRGEPNEFDTEYDADAEAAAEDEPAPRKTPETVDSDPDLVTITVDGVEKTVSRSEVEKAGIAAMQKLSAADQRMRDASTYEASLKTLEASLRKQMEDIQEVLDNI